MSIAGSDESSCSGFFLAPNAGECGTESSSPCVRFDEIAVGVDQRLLGFDLGDDSLLNFAGYLSLTQQAETIEAARFATCKKPGQYSLAP